MLEKKKGCCEKCKGRCKSYGAFSLHNIHMYVTFWLNHTECIYNGERYASGAEWTDADDPCTSYKCIAGVVTESNIQCYTPCNNPLLPRPGQCCSTCMGELFFHYFFTYTYSYDKNWNQNTPKLPTCVLSFLWQNFVYTSMTILTCPRYIEKFYEKNIVLAMIGGNENHRKNNSSGYRNVRVSAHAVLLRFIFFFSFKDAYLPQIQEQTTSKTTTT